MSAIFGRYDPNSLICSIDGVIISGFSDGDAIICRRSEDEHFVRIGIDGGVGIARNANKSGEIEIRALQTSKINQLLSSLFAVDNLRTGSSRIVPITVADYSGASLCAATKCWLKTMPEASFGKEVGERVWVFGAADLIIFHGGNNG